MIASGGWQGEKSKVWQILLGQTGDAIDAIIDDLLFTGTAVPRITGAPTNSFQAELR